MMARFASQPFIRETIRESRLEVHFTFYKSLVNCAVTLI